MSYTPTNWKSDDVVTTARMNKLESAVGEMNMSYTPNVWVDGDVLTASKMNTLEQAVASGGGGGGGDFSTAEVTINVSGQQGYVPVIRIHGMVLLMDEDGEKWAETDPTLPTGVVVPYTVLLVDGASWVEVESLVGDITSITASGNIEVDGVYVGITGNGTINIEWTES